MRAQSPTSWARDWAKTSSPITGPAQAGTSPLRQRLARYPTDTRCSGRRGATHGVNPWIYGSNARFDPINDFTAVGLVGQTPIVMVTAPGSGLRSVHDLLRQAKAHPEKLTFGSGGHGTTPHMAGELLKSSAGVKLMHVAYKGSQPALTDAMAGRLDIAFHGVASAVGYIRSGELVALGVSTRERLTALPDVAPIGMPFPALISRAGAALRRPRASPPL